MTPQLDAASGTARIAATMAALKARNEGAFMPFMVLGDPDVERSIAIAEALVEGGADILELGFPFSDPPADGPVIQAADLRALGAGTTVSDCLTAIATIRGRHRTPIALLIYFNLVLQRGVDRFYREAAAAGVDAILVADVPLERGGPLLAAAEAHGIAPVFIAAPSTSNERLSRIAARADGYIYTVARVGITGEQTDVRADLAGTIRRVRAATSLPTLAGFGIATPQHVREVMQAGADGAICGSAIVRRIEAHARGACTLAELLDDLRAFCAAMKAATLNTPNRRVPC